MNRIEILYKLRDELSSASSKMNQTYKAASAGIVASSKTQQQAFKGVADSVNRTKRNVNSFSSGLQTHQNSVKSLKDQLFSLKAAYVGIAAFVGGKLIRSFVTAGSEVESLEVQFHTLLGSAEAAKERLEDLDLFSQKTQFQLKGVAQASRILETLTRGALSAGDGLRMVGDVAAATGDVADKSGQHFANLSMHIGRLYDGLRNNRPVGESMMRLQELGIITGKTRGEIEKLQKAGKGTEAWDVLKKQLDRYNGAMKLSSATMAGLASTFSDLTGKVMRQFLDGGIWEDAKGGMQGLVDITNKLIESGKIEEFGKNISFAFNTIAAGANIATTSIATFGKMLFAGLEETAKLTKTLPAIIPGFSLFALALNKDGKDISETMGGIADSFEKLSENAAGNALKNFEKMAKLIEGIEEPKSTKPVTKKEDETISGGGLSEDRAREQAQLILEIQKQYRQLGIDERDKELDDLANWYIEKTQIIGNDIEAQRQLWNVFSEKEKEIFTKGYEKQKEAIINAQEKFAALRRTAKEQEQYELLLAFQEQAKLIGTATIEAEKAQLALAEVFFAELLKIEEEFGQERLNTIANIHSEYEEVTRSARELELGRLSVWYAKQKEIIGDGTEEAQKARLELTEVYNAKIEQAEAKSTSIRIGYLQSLTDSTYKTFDSIGKILKLSEESNREYSIFMKMLAIGQTIVNTMAAAQSTYKSVSEQVGGIPGYIAGGIAAGAVTTEGLARVAVIGSQKFQDGGIVKGSSMTGDRVPIFANSREMVLTTDHQAGLFRFINDLKFDRAQTIQNTDNRSNLVVNLTINGNATTETIDDAIMKLKNVVYEAKYRGVDIGFAA